MAFDVAIVLVLFAFAWLGAHRGGPESAARLFGLGFAYGAAVLAPRVVGGALAEAVGGSPWIGFLLAGCGGFLAAQALVEIAARKLRRDSDDLSDASRIAGAAFGMARAALLLVPVLWLAAFSESVRASGAAVSLPDLSGARSTSVGEAVAGAAAVTLAHGGDRGDRVTAKFVAAPGASIAAMTAIASDPRMRALQADAGFWRDVRAGELDAALARPTFAQLARDGSLRAQLADLGLVGDASAVDAAMFEEEMRGVLGELGPRLQRLEADPDFHALLADEELRARAQSGDVLSVLADPRVRRVVASVSE